MTKRQPDGCTNPIDAVLRQDQAYGPEATDLDLWFTTLHFPLAMVASAYTRIIETPEQARTEMIALEKASRAEGIVTLKTQIMTHVQPSDDMSIVCSVRERLNASGKRVAAASMTFILMREGDIWRIRTIHFDDDQIDESMTTQVTRQQGDEE